MWGIFLSQLNENLVATGKLFQATLLRWFFCTKKLGVSTCKVTSKRLKPLANRSSPYRTTGTAKKQSHRALTIRTAKFITFLERTRKRYRCSGTAYIIAIWSTVQDKLKIIWLGGEIHTKSVVITWQYYLLRSASLPWDSVKLSGKGYWYRHSTGYTAVSKTE
jgi:hypothetical protein